MSKTILQYTVMFVILILAQAIVFNHICLFGVALPLVFICFIVKLPLSLGLNWVLTLGFLLGFMMDIFSDTPGLNALCCTVLSALRRLVVRLYMPRNDEMSDTVPSARSMGSSVYMKYLFTMSMIYAALYFMIESMTFFNFGRLVLKVLSSGLLTFLFIMAIGSLTSRRREKRL